MKKKTGAFKVYLRFIASVYRNNKLFVLSKVFISVLAGLLSVVTAVLPKYMADFDRQQRVRLYRLCASLCSGAAHHRRG